MQCAARLLAECPAWSVDFWVTSGHETCSTPARGFTLNGMYWWWGFVVAFGVVSESPDIWPKSFMPPGLPPVWSSASHQGCCQSVHYLAVREIYGTGFYQASRLKGYFVAQIRHNSKFLAAPIFYRQIF